MDQELTFRDLGLSEEILKALEKRFLSNVFGLKESHICFTTSKHLHEMANIVNENTKETIVL